MDDEVREFLAAQAACCYEAAYYSERQAIVTETMKERDEQ